MSWSIDTKFRRSRGPISRISGTSEAACTSHLKDNPIVRSLKFNTDSAVSSDDGRLTEERDLKQPPSV